ncbi:MAG: hypothetical protein D6681_10960 [Calditrichaeota bacterium]|nr:MAG: hypothetical protein D6681_10960 [Calditrichota bacterium]
MGFIDQAVQEKELQGIIQTEQLREIRRLVEAQLQQQTKQTGFQEAIHKEVTEIAKHVSGQNAVEDARRDYLENLRAYCQMLPLAALGEETGTEQDVTLDDVYIELNTTTEVEIPGKKDERRKTRPLTVREAAAQSKRMVLLGDPGAGKSTFAKKLCGWLAAVQLGEIQTPPPGFDDDLLPVMIILRELAPKLEPEELKKLSAQKRREKLVNIIREHVCTDARAFAQPLWNAVLSGKVLLVFDGLDEVPTAKRSLTVDAVKALLTFYKKIARVIVTCRIRSYTGEAMLPNFSHFTLAKLTEDQIRGFVKAWYGCLLKLKKVEPKIGESERDDLIRAALSEELRPLAENPMMLTAMAIMRRKRRLPKEKAQLFKLLVEVLLRRWQEEKFSREEWVASDSLRKLLADEDKLQDLMERLAYEAHRMGKGKKEADLQWSRAVEILSEKGHLGARTPAIEFLDYLDQRAGLLSGRGGEPGGPGTYSFAHRQLQEYLAGAYIMEGRSESVARELKKLAREGDYWSEAVKMGFEDLRYNRRNKTTLLELAYRLCPSENPGSEIDQRLALWSSYIAVLLGKTEFEQDREFGGPEYWERIIHVLTNHLLIGQLTPIERADAGRHLAILGDPRTEVMTVDAMQFCYVPPGEFYYGEGNQAKLKNLDYPYWMGRFPVTNAQFQAFVEDDGYGEKYEQLCWQEAKKAGYWSKAGFKGIEDDKPRRALENWGSPFNLPNHPVVGVSWYEALAFCRWLTAYYRQKGWLTDGQHIRLPHETEWEKAARCGLSIPAEPIIRPIHQIPVDHSPLTIDHSPLTIDHSPLQPNPSKRRRYPWESPNPSPNLANYDGTGIGATSAVGCFPGGKSPCGCEEMAGNVWEWMENLYSDIGHNRSVRGGSWGFRSDLLRCSARSGLRPVNQWLYVGFRVVLCARSQK